MTSLFFGDNYECLLTELKLVDFNKPISCIMKRIILFVVIAVGTLLPVISLASVANDDCPGTTLTVTRTCIVTSGTVIGATRSGIPKASCDPFTGIPHLQDV